MTKYVLGIDGGGTKTLCLLANQYGVVIGQGLGGPSNPYHASDDDLKTAFHTSIHAALAHLSTPIELAAICVGCAGAHNPVQQQRVQGLIWQALQMLPTHLITLSTTPPPTEVYLDMVTSLAAGTGERFGIVVISGTGSSIYGETREGQQVQVGGWGKFLDDEGSGYEIGRLALRAAVKAYDGRLSSTLLEPLMLKHWQYSSLDILFERVLTQPFTIPEIASMAEVTYHAAQQGDAIALQILSEVGQQLAHGVLTAAHRLELTDQKFPLVMSGSILKNIEMVRKQLLTKVQAKLPFVEPIHLQVEPAMGAVYLALKSLAH